MKQISIFYGEDRYSINKSIENAKKTILGTNSSDLNLEVFYSDEIDLTEVLQKSYVETFFSTNRITIIKFLNMKSFDDLEKDNKKELIDYIESPPQNAFLLISIYGKGEKRKDKKSNNFINEIMESGQSKYLEIQEFPLPKSYTVISFIGEKCRTAGKYIAKDAENLLVERCECDLMNLDNELKKLFLYTKDRKNITLSDVENVIVDSKTKSIFELLDFIGTKNISNSLLLLNKIFKKDEDAQAMMVVITQYFREIWIVKSLSSKGRRESEIAKLLGPKGYFIKKFLTAANNFSFDRLSQIFEQLLNTDLTIKTRSLPVKFILESLLVKLCS